MPQKYRITTDQGTFEVTTEDSTQQARQPMEADAAQSWRGSADPDGAMALAGIANEHPVAAAAGAAAPLVMANPGLVGGALKAGILGAFNNPVIQSGLGAYEGYQAFGWPGAIMGAATGPALGTVHKYLRAGTQASEAAAEASRAAAALSKSRMPQAIQQVTSPGLGDMLSRPATAEAIRQAEETVRRNQLNRVLGSFK